MVQDNFLVLRNVCLTKAQNKYVLHFFGSGTDVVNIFKKKASPYSAWSSDIKNIPPLEGVPSVRLTNTTVTQFLARNNGTDASVSEGTTLIAEPHHPDNNFHIHNDLIIPILYKMVKSASVHLQKGHKRRLILTHGSRNLFNKRVVAFDVLNKLFDEVRYPLENILEEQCGGIVCFERLIMGGKGTAYPYYSSPGRFGEDDRWRGVIPEIRDWVNEVHGIEVKKGSNVNTTIAKPRLTWIDRPCVSGARCLQNVSGLIRHLSRRFNVTTLSFDRGKDRANQLMNMLWQMASTDILAGMHGAGLAHAAYLQPGSVLVEIKDIHMRENKLFLNMANKQTLGITFLMQLQPMREVKARH